MQPQRKLYQQRLRQGRLQWHERGHEEMHVDVQDLNLGACHALLRALPRIMRPLEPLCIFGRLTPVSRSSA